MLTEQTQIQNLRIAGFEQVCCGQLDEAMRKYAELLRMAPQDVQTYLTLGDIFLSEGDTETALVLYSHALGVEPENEDAQRRLKLARLEQQSANPLEFSSGSAPLVQSARPRAGNPEISEDQITSARLLLETAASQADSAAWIEANLDTIQGLLPAFLEINRRSAEAEARPDLARELSRLVQQVQPSGPQPAASPPDLQVQPAAEPVYTSSSLPRLLFVGPESGQSWLRQELPVQALSAMGFAVDIRHTLSEAQAGEWDLIVAHMPHASSEVMAALAAHSAARTPIILDLDCDCEKMPVYHAEFHRYGLYTPELSAAYREALQLADCVTVPNLNLAAELQSSARTIEVIPDGWAWTGAKPERRPGQSHQLNLGWVGREGQLEDAAVVRRVLIRVLREFADVQLVIVGDAQVYRMFENLPESRRLFIPTPGYEDLPYMLAQLDILVAPYRNTPFNHFESDWLLLQASGLGVPWVASALPAFKAWGRGGLLASTPDEWHTALRQLVMDQNVRQELAADGRRAAESRQMDFVAQSWSRVILDVYQQRAACWGANENRQLEGTRR